MKPALIPAYDLRRNLGTYLDRVLKGEALVLTRNGKRIALILPPDTTPADLEALVPELDRPVAIEGGR